MSDHLFARFEQVRIINLADRPDRRAEMNAQLQRIGKVPPNVRFFGATRPGDAGEFPSIGARGCFESHLAVLTDARNARAASLLLIEDDFDFSRDGLLRASGLFDTLQSKTWAIFHGGHALAPNRGEGLQLLDSGEPVMTASFVGFNGAILAELVAFLEAMLTRPAGSPDFGPMHVDGAYSVFRRLNPQLNCYAALPSLGRQRSSASDITPGGLVFDRWSATRNVANVLRRGRNWLRS